MNQPSRSNQSTAFEVLIVENDPAASRLTQEAFRETGVTEGVRCVSDGEEALNLLRGTGTYTGHPHTDIIFLDLHLPKKSGLEVLKKIIVSERSQTTPDVV